MCAYMYVHNKNHKALMDFNLVQDNNGLQRWLYLAYLPSTTDHAVHYCFVQTALSGTAGYSNSIKEVVLGTPKLILKYWMPLIL